MAEKLKSDFEAADAKAKEAQSKIKELNAKVAVSKMNEDYANKKANDLKTEVIKKEKADSNSSNKANIYTTKEELQC
jgi:hypothetical protein